MQRTLQVLRIYLTDSNVESDQVKADSEELLEEQAIEQALDDAFNSFKDQQKSKSNDLEASESTDTGDADEEELMRSLDSNNFDDLFPKV